MIATTNRRFFINRLHNGMMIPAWLHRLRTSVAASSMKGREICRKAGIGQSVLSEILSGANTPKIDTLIKICEALSVTPGYILDGAETDPRSNSMLRQWNALPEEQQDAVLSVIDAMLTRK